MIILEVDPSSIDLQVIATAVDILKTGGIVAHPTDTCYGLAVDISNSNALKELYERKGMDSSKPVSFLVRSLEEAQQYGEFSPMALRMAQEFWPGPLTLVVPRKTTVPDCLNPGATTVGIRVIAEPVTNALLEAFGGPFTTTSANFHGKSSPYRVSDLSVEPDLVLDVGALREQEKPSTVMKIDGDNVVTLRQGNLFFPL